MLSVSKFPIFWEKPERCEDFIVEEIIQDKEKKNHVLELNKPYQKLDTANPDIDKLFHLHFVLQKTNWSTNDALRTITRRLKISKKRFSYAGTKDKCAVTTQVASLFAVRKEELEQVFKKNQIKEMKLLGMWYEKDKIRMGKLIGNRFTIKDHKLTMKDKEIIEEAIKEQCEECARDRYPRIKLPNYFGIQRFGSNRYNTHLVGYHMLKREFDKAVWNYITYSNGEKNERSLKFRKNVIETGNGSIQNIDEKGWNMLIQECPKHLKYERIIMSHLARQNCSNDYINAIRKLPRGISLMFIHALQSWIFNEELRRRIKNRAITDTLNIIGYETDLNNYEKEILDDIELSTEDFKLRQIPELACKGTKRPFMMSISGIELVEDEDNFRDGSRDNKSSIRIRFSLPPGSYATSVMGQLIPK